MNSVKADTVTIEFLRCPHGTTAVAIDDRRVTRGKCCGTWNINYTVRVPRSEIQSAIDRTKPKDEP